MLTEEEADSRGAYPNQRYPPASAIFGPISQASAWHLTQTRVLRSLVQCWARQVASDHDIDEASAEQPLKRSFLSSHFFSQIARRPAREFLLTEHEL